MEEPNSEKPTKYYLVKWRSLQYEDSTWELEQDVDPAKIEVFERIRHTPSKDQWKVYIMFYYLKNINYRLKKYDDCSHANMNVYITIKVLTLTF